MLLKDKNRNLPTIILKKMGNNEEKMQMRPESAGAEMTESEDLYMVADEVMEAIKNSDIRALKEALSSFVECCANNNPQEMESESKDSDY